MRIPLPTSLAELRGLATPMSAPTLLLALLVLLTAGLAQAAPTSDAAPKLRYWRDQYGDFALIGNTLAQDCRNTTPPPLIGKMPPVEVYIPGERACYRRDTSPDFFWTLDDWTLGDTGATTQPYLPPDGSTPALANPLAARSQAVLTLPAGARVTYARLYWAATRYNGSGGDGVAAPDLTATLARPGVAGFEKTITADDYAFENTSGAEYQYQSTADITDIVKGYGPGAYQVTDVQAIPLDATTGELLFDAWWMVVFYEVPGETTRRHLKLYDSMRVVASPPGTEVLLEGFYVPSYDVAARLGVVAFEGEDPAPDINDTFEFNDVFISNDLNPANNFFNSTRSWTTRKTGVTTDTPLTGIGPGLDEVLDTLPMSNRYDRPQLTGTPGSMSGMDLDVVDVPIASGDTSARVRVNTSGDKFWLGGLVASITTQAPDFTHTIKSAKNLTRDDGTVRPGDIIEYTISTINVGDDHSRDTVLTDPLPPQLDYVPGSLMLLSVAASDTLPPGPLTDAKGDDVGEYDAATHSVTVYLGKGATPSIGGTLKGIITAGDVGESTSISFQMQVKPTTSMGTVKNQAFVSAGGMLGTSPVTTPSRSPAGSGPTSIIVTTQAPNFANTVKTARNLTRADGTVRPGDIIEYTISTRNVGNDPSRDTVLADPLPSQLDYVPGSLKLLTVAASDTTPPGALTDAEGDDVGEYDAITRTLTVHLGTGATPSKGGILKGMEGEGDVGESTSISFQMQVKPTTGGRVENQAIITAIGQWDSQEHHAESRPDGASPAGPTSIIVSLPAELTISAPLPGAYVSTPWPSFEGTAEQGNTVIVSQNDAQVCTVKADALSGFWSCVSSLALAEGGPYVVSVHSEDSSGNSSPPASRRFYVDSVAPIPFISSPVQDGFVSTGKPRFTGSLEAYASLTLAIDGREYDSIDVGLDGTWSFTVPDPLLDGRHTLTATGIDRARNTGSTSLSWSQDTEPPGAPVVVEPKPGTRLFTRTPSFSGTTEPASTVRVFLDGTEVGTAQAGADGSWRLVSSTRFPPGPHRAWAVANDAAGNSSGQSPEVAFSTSPGSPYGPGCAAAASDTACWPWALLLLGLPLRRRLSSQVDATVLADPGSSSRSPGLRALWGCARTSAVRTSTDERAHVPFLPCLWNAHSHGRGGLPARWNSRAGHAGLPWHANPLASRAAAGSPAGRGSRPDTG